MPAHQIRCGLLVLIMTTMSWSVQAEPTSPCSGHPDIKALLGIDSKTAASVERILQEQHDKHEQLRRDTDDKLSKLLSTTQLETLHRNIPPPPPPKARSDAPPLKE